MPQVTDDQLATVRPVVTNIINRLRHRGTLQPHHETDDLHSVGMTAAWRALQTHDPARGASPATYVAHRVTGALLDYQRQDGKAHGYSRTLGRVVTILSLDMDIPAGDGTVPLADTIPDPVDVAHLAETRVEAHRLLRIVAGFNDQDKAVVAGYLTDTPYAAVGRHLRVTESRVCQIAARLPHRIRLAEAA